MTARILYLVRFYLLTVIIFLAAKLVFMLCLSGDHPFTAVDAVDVALHGLTLDLSTALYALIVPFLLTAASLWCRLPVWTARIYYAILSIAMTLAFVADTSLYQFWGFKLDASCLQYLETPEGITASVGWGYLAFRAVLLVLLSFLLYNLYARIPQKFPELPSLKHRLAHSALYLLLIPLMVVGIRGGIDESTTNIGQAYFSQNQFLNHAAVNPVFSFLSSLGHQMGDMSQYEFMDQEEAEALTRNLFSTASVLAPADTLLNTTRPNIVVVLLESAGEQFAEAMPRLQKLKHEGVYFSQCYANSWRTDRGTVCVLSGYPSFPSVSVMKMPQKSRTLPSLARTLQAEGYSTTYLYGGDINFTNMRSYLISTGWERLISMEDYSQGEQHSAQWGVRDDITFQTLYEQITSFDPRRPYLVGYSTLSSHEPWDVPTKTLDDKVLNAFAYLDNCLYDFVQQLRKSPCWEQLLLVLVADHGINHQQVGQATPKEKNHIPMLWLGGAVKEPREVETLCNQTDLCATLLGQMELPHDGFRFSRDVLSSTCHYPLAINNFSNAQWIADSTGHLLYDFDARKAIVSETTDEQRLLDVSKAILQVTHQDLWERGMQK